MKNKLFKLTALWIVVVGLAGCQSDVDVLGISNDLALGKMPGYYTFTEVDSVAMTVTKTEYYLEKMKDGIGKGYRRVSTSGMCTPTDTQEPITWSAVMAENKLSMTTTIAYENGDTEVFKWMDGVLQETEDSSQKTAASSITSLFDIYDKLANTKFEISQKSYYPHPDTVEYVAWKTENDFFAPEDTAAQKAAYLNELTPYLDTIKWYLGYVGQIGTVYLDSVTGELHNLVVVSPEPSKRGSNKGKHGITHVIMIDTLQTRVDQINDRPAQMLNSTLAFMRVGETNTGSLLYSKQTWTEEYYIDPSSPQAIATDSMYSFDASAWAVSSVTSSVAFDVLFKGVENGQTQDAFTTINVSDFNKEKGEMVVGTLKYKVKQ